MSATGRSDVRRPLDVYDTPEWCVRWLLDCPSFIGSIMAFEERSVDAVTLCDPCAGSGSIAAAVDDWTNDRWHKNTAWMTWDVEPRSELVKRRDYLDPGFAPPHADLLITNPPYSLAEEFIRKAVSHATSVAMLLRLPFMASKKRLPLWRDLGVPDVYVLSKRPSFTGGGTDSTDYAWLVWPSTGDAVKRDRGVVRVLDGGRG